MLFITVFSLRVLFLPLNSDTTDTTIVIIDPICDEQYHSQQKEMNYFLNEILKAFEIEIPDSLNHK